VTFINGLYRSRSKSIASLHLQAIDEVRDITISSIAGWMRVRIMAIRYRRCNVPAKHQLLRLPRRLWVHWCRAPAVRLASKVRRWTEQLNSTDVR
jgi:hypothetical protein